MLYCGQREQKDCVLASLTMFLSTYRPEPVNHIYKTLINMLDVAAIYNPHHQVEFFQGNGIYPYFAPLACHSFDVNLLEIHLFDFNLDSYILVPSKSDSASQHAVCWDAKQQRVLDPSGSNKYTNDELQNIINSSQVRVFVDGDLFEREYNLKKERIECQENTA